MAVILEPGITEDNLSVLYQDGRIQDRISTDLRPASVIDHPLVNYLSVFDDGEFVGAYLVIDFSPYEKEVHMHLMKKGMRASRESSRLVANRIFTDQHIQRITVWVSSGIPTVVNHCVNMGFVVEGVKRSAIMAGGELLDLVLLGLTREDWRVKKWAV